MRKVLLALALLGMAAGSAMATPENLSGGVFIAHYAPSLVWTSTPPAGGWGDALQSSEDAIDECADQLNRLDGQADHMMWFIISAWDAEDKVWCSTQMGLEAYDVGVWVFQTNGPVYPGGGGGLEIYTNNFPYGDPPGGPSGVICGPSGGGWGPANFEPVWWFEGYAYGASYGTTVLQLGTDPATGFGGFYNCESPPGEFGARCFGAMGVNTDGVACCPEPQAPEFACCFEDGACEVLTEEDCMAVGGMPMPWDYCEPNDCPQPEVAACCFEDGSCVELTLDVCAASGGEWLQGLLCEPDNPCPQPVAACCDMDANCYMMTEADCAESGWDFYGDEDCNTFACPSATDDPSWGSIKAMYR